MCGFAGFCQSDGQTQASLRAQVRAMATTLAHRGPDDADEWVDETTGVALGFRRLAIIDLSPGGRQPMHSPSGRYVITFNGEVYNFRELRNELEQHGYVFRGSSDTEVMLAAIEGSGLENAVRRFVGMFAFVLWDRKTRRLSLVRDRLGIKPLYYGWMGRTFLWGSELKALRVHPAFRAEIDRGALTLLMRHNYVPAPYSIYKGILKLPPGCSLTIDISKTGYPSPVAYWSVREAFEKGAANPFTGSEDEAIQRLDVLLRDAVKLRMIADVPLGAFLSGGVDSSTVVALMQSQSRHSVKTFSIGFEEASYDEAIHARAVADHLGTDHRELYATAAEAQRVIPRLPEIYDEPFSDPSQIPTFLVSRLTRQHVTVSLSGDGGDELFGGYDRYFTANAIWRAIRRVPVLWRRSLAKIICAADTGHRIRTRAEMLAMPTPQALYHRIMSHWKRPAEIVIGGFEPPSLLAGLNGHVEFKDFYRHMMYADTVAYMPDDVLAKVDRASSAVSLEARVPLIDHRVVEFAARLPTAMKIRNGQGKWILRQVLYKYVPARLIDRPKMGFGVPIDSWLRGPLRDWAETLLSERRLRAEGFFNPEPIRGKWAKHLARHCDWHYYLWDVLMFQAWLEHQQEIHQQLTCVESTVS
jgi:asparagine synthase (glutamine-hydrolysing)